MLRTRKELPMTKSQQKALHLYFRFIADSLNSSGHEKKVILENIVDIPWNAVTVKENLWRPLQYAELLKQSTTELTTSDVNKVFATLSRHLAPYGIDQDFPHIDALSEYYEAQKKAFIT